MNAFRIWLIQRYPLIATASTCKKMSYGDLVHFKDKYREVPFLSVMTVVWYERDYLELSYIAIDLYAIVILKEEQL
jgi:hypothetical protein